jgi:hypothetical protein
MIGLGVLYELYDYTLEALYDIRNESRNVNEPFSQLVRPAKFLRVK